MNSLKYTSNNEVLSTNNDKKIDEVINDINKTVDDIIEKWIYYDSERNALIMSNPVSTRVINFYSNCRSYLNNFCCDIDDFNSNISELKVSFTRSCVLYCPVTGKYEDSIRDEVQFEIKMKIKEMANHKKQVREILKLKIYDRIDRIINNRS